MAETRLKAWVKEALIHDAEETLGTKLELILAKTQALEGSIAEQNKLAIERTQALEGKMDERIGEMFEAICLMATNNASSSGVPNQNRMSPVATTPNGAFDNQEQTHGARMGNQNHYSGITRLGKVDFPRFAGEKFKEWVFKAEEFFVIDYTPSDMKIKIAALHFDSHAATWHYSLVQSANGGNLGMDWDAYKLLLQERFEDVLDDPIAELKQLQETEGIVEYHEKFELIKTRVNLSEEFLVSAYLAGLRLDTQLHVRMFQPRSIRQCLLLGRLYERAHPRENFNTSWSNAKSVAGNAQGKGILPTKKEQEYRNVVQQVAAANQDQKLQPRRVEARTSCDHLNSLSPNLLQIPTPDTPCSRCQNPVENWLCLCCKEVLCSRFVNRHMLMHHQQTGHCLALGYSDLSVWCYCCEAYLDAQIILQLRPIHQAAYILKFGEAPPLPQL